MLLVKLLFCVKKIKNFLPKRLAPRKVPSIKEKKHSGSQISLQYSFFCSLTGLQRIHYLASKSYFLPFLQAARCSNLCRHLLKLDADQHVRSATGCVHVSRGRSSIDCSQLHKLLNRFVVTTRVFTETFHVKPYFVVFAHLSITYVCKYLLQQI